MKIYKRVRRKVNKKRKIISMYWNYFFNNRNIKTPNKCIICFSNELKPAFIHHEWYKMVYKCHKCGHIALYDSMSNKQSSDSFKTSISRADFYLGKLENISFNSILEIGTPDDFYFLKKLHKFKPEVVKYGYDIFPKKNVPEYIEMLDNLNGVQVDLVYATHVLEHIPDLHEFVRILSKISKIFIIEVPSTPDWFVDKIMKGEYRTGYHYHFFSEESLNILLKNTGCRILNRTIVYKGIEKKELVAIKGANISI